MFDFARTNWLGLFALTALFFAAYLLARRYRAARVTYGQVWHSVARKLRAPAWKRVLRTLLTLLLSLALLSSLILYAAGLQRPRAEEPAPLLIAIAVDCTPSMRARAGDSTRGALAWLRAHEILAAMGPDDRAVVFHFVRGAPVGSPWLRAGDMPMGPNATDFAPPDLAALCEATKAMQPPGMAALPAPLRFIWWLGDTPPEGGAIATPPRLADTGAQWRDIHGVPVLVETLGEESTNDAVTAVQWHATPRGPGRGRIEIETLSGKGVYLRRLGPAATNPPQEAGLAFELATDDMTLEFEAKVAGGDGLPQDDAVRFTLQLPRLTSAHLCWTPADGEANPLLLDILRELLPGVQVTHGSADQPVPATDLLICDRAAPHTTNARFVLGFTALPRALGSVGTGIRVAPGLQKNERPASLDFEAPDLTLVQGRDVAPLTAGEGLRPLLRGVAGEVLVAEGTAGATRVLYSGFAPNLSTLIEDQGGLLLLMRWFGAIRAEPRDALPPVLGVGETVEFELPGPGGVNVTLGSSPWETVAGKGGFTLTPGPDGRATFGPLAIPGRWRVGASGAITAIWSDKAEQALPFVALPRENLDALRPATDGDWRDLLPALLLWIALVLVLLEWILWLTGVTD